MAAKIRLKRVGRRGQPSYRVVVLDGQKPRDAKVVADLGYYDPKTNPPTFEIDGEGALKWLLEGAKATRAARGVLSKAGVMAAWDAAKRGETVEIEAKELKPTAKPKKAKAAAAEESAEDAEPPAEDAEPPAEAGEEPAEAGEGAPDEVSAEAEAEEEEQETEEAAPAEAADEEGDADEESEEEEKA
jgi:small subunit ribosomal protein S16